MKNLLILALVSLMSCASENVEPAAIIEGDVTIGPLCGNTPVGLPNDKVSINPCGFSNADLDKIYGEYSVVIRDSKNVIVSQKKLDYTGNFSFTVNDGTYLLKIENKDANALANTQKSQIEKSIVATKDKKQIVSIWISTGIR